MPARRSPRLLEREHSIKIKRVVPARTVAGAVEVRGAAVEMIIERILQANARVEPGPPARSAVAEGDVVRLEDPAVGVRAAVVGWQAAVQPQILAAADVEVGDVDAVNVVIEIARLRLERVEV